MRILQIVPTLGRGGAELSLLYASAELARRGHHVEVVALRAPYELLADFSAAGIVVHKLDCSRAWRYPRALLRMIGLLRRGSFDVTRALMFEASVVSALTGWAAPNSRRLVSYHHVDFDIFPANTVLRQVRKALFGILMRNTVDGHVAISAAVARHYESHLRLSHVDVVPNGFPVQQLQSEANEPRTVVRDRLGLADEFVCICPARFSQEKGHTYLFEAVASLRREGQSISLLLYGRGILEHWLREECDRLGISDRVRFRGVVPSSELMPVIAASDALVLPSPRGEGFGRVLAEAMTVGVPVVTPGVAGALDFVTDRVSGLLIEPASSEAIATAIRELAARPDFRASLGAAARLRIERDFDIANCADEWERLLTRAPLPQST